MNRTTPQQAQAYESSVRIKTLNNCLHGAMLLRTQGMH